jgi:hypothetical protein
MKAFGTVPLLVAWAVAAGVACGRGAGAEGEAQGDSVAVWVEVMKSGALDDRVAAAGKLAAQEPASLPPAAREAVVAELRRLNDALLGRRPIEGLDELDPESFGEYYLDLATMAARFESPEADRALILSVGVSRGVQRRVARLGDGAVPVLAEMVARDYQAADALQAMALAWFWADSTGAPLSERSRAMILDALVAATRSPSYSLRRGAATALALSGDPALLPLVDTFRSAASQTGERLIVAALDAEAAPRLEAAAASLGARAVATRSLRILRLICRQTAGAKEPACTRLAERFSTAVAALEAGRAEEAARALEDVARVAEAAAGAFTEEERALILGGARLVIGRL